MSIERFSILVGVLLLGWIALNIAWAIRDNRLSKASVVRMEEHPEDVVMAHLADDGELLLTVQFRDEQPVDLFTVRGLTAVRLFDKLAISAPHAFRHVTRYGRNVPA